jgi:hypothetical protein
MSRRSSAVEIPNGGLATTLKARRGRRRSEASAPHNPDNLASKASSQRGSTVRVQFDSHDTGTYRHDRGRDGPGPRANVDNELGSTGTT